jgi:hypothetical protein
VIFFIADSCAGPGGERIKILQNEIRLKIPQNEIPFKIPQNEIPNKTPQNEIPLSPSKNENGVNHCCFTPFLLIVTSGSLP